MEPAAKKSKIVVNPKDDCSDDDDVIDARVTARMAVVVWYKRHPPSGMLHPSVSGWNEDTFIGLSGL